MPTRPITGPVLRPILRRLSQAWHAVGRIVRPGDYLMDETRTNNLTDELGNRLTG